ncbi:hypothetical protein DIPPA_25290 [Diplonema papillatum]|nr:hypothetical protein DIPPA_25290 [Diplonema papillatum]
MLLTEADFSSTWKSEVIQRWIDSGRSTSVHCIVGDDVDAVCALKVTMQLLLKNKIDPVVTPVQNLSDLQKALAELPTVADPAQPSTVLLVNCSGACPLNKLQPKGGASVHEVDAHRPVLRQRCVPSHSLSSRQCAIFHC